jgi:SNF2 family DNA or RNA helicase
MRVLKEEVLDLEVPNVIPVDVKMSPSHSKLYRTLLDERMLEIGGEVVPVIQSQTLRRYAMQIASDPSAYTDGKVVNNTLPRLLDLLDSVGVVKFNKAQSLAKDSQMTKVVIFAHYKQTILMLQEALKHLNPAVISGKTNTDANKKMFIEDETCRAVIIQPQSGGAGLDGMQNVCHNIVFFEPVTSPGIFDQCASRLIRSGQKKVVNVYVFNVLGTVYARAIRVMLGRAGDMKDVVVKVGDFINELLGKL